MSAPRLLRVRCWLCGCPIRLHAAGGCRGRQELLPGELVPCTCGLDDIEAARAIPPATCPECGCLIVLASGAHTCPIPPERGQA